MEYYKKKGKKQTRCADVNKHPHYQNRGAVCVNNTVQRCVHQH